MAAARSATLKKDGIGMAIWRSASEQVTERSSLRDRPNRRSLHLRSVGLLVALFTVFLLLPSIASAAECTNTWTGPAEGTWQTSANWSAGHAPTSTDVACIPTGKTVTVSEGSNLTGTVKGEGTLRISGGSL